MTDRHTRSMGAERSDEDWDGDAGGDRNNGWYDEECAWLDRWAPKCPIRNPQRVGRLLGYREREPGRLQLRVAIRPRTDGVCEAIAEESEATVHVRVLLCFEDRDESWDDREYWDCPVHVYLEKPLGARTVIAVDGNEALPLYAPRWEIEHNRRVEQENRRRRLADSTEA
jgi:hypothetical protein